MTIQAKFPGTCSKCGSRFAAGTSIEWSRGQAARHTSCTITTVKSTGQCRRCGTYCYGDCTAVAPAGRWHSSRSDANSTAWARMGYGDGDL